VVADPDRLGSLLPALEGVSAVVWLLSRASGESRAALHGPRLEALLERLVDTPVRGFVYEPAEPGGSGEPIVRAASRRWHIPVEVVEQNGLEHEAWLARMGEAVARVLN
jgi:hypothetical protein